MRIIQQKRKSTRFVLITMVMENRVDSVDRIKLLKFKERGRRRVRNMMLCLIG